MAFKDWLAHTKSEHKDAFENATLDSGGEEVKDGVYTVRVESIMAKDSKNGNKMVEWKLIVLEGSEKGRIIWKHNMLTGADKMEWFAKDLMRAGINPGRYEDLSTTLELLLDKELTVEVKTNIHNGKNYLNIYISGYITTDIDSVQYPF